MEQLIQSVDQVRKEECERIFEEHGTVYHTDHEGFAILLEELEEASAEIHDTTSLVHSLWGLVKNKESTDEDKLEILRIIRGRAVLAACEAIQVAAVATKFQRTIEEGSVEECSQ